MKLKFIQSCLVLMLLASISNTINAQSLTEYAQQKKLEIAEQKRIEKATYDEACQRGTLEAYQEYAQLYPKGKYIEDVNSRIEEFSLWSVAKSENTIQSYETYLQKSKYKTFENDANLAIEDLQSQEEWAKVESILVPKDTLGRISFSACKSAIRNFIYKYPKSSTLTRAKKTLSEIEAMEYYADGNYLLALRKFDEVGGIDSIRTTNRSIYRSCKEYSDYKNASSEQSCKDFLTTYPNSQYYNEVSNTLAILKAQSMSMYASDLEWIDVLSLTTDETARATVNRYIQESKLALKRKESQERKNRIRRNGGYVQFGLEFLDVGVNMAFKKRTIDIVYYNVGLGLKIGNYKAPVQLALGVKPGCVIYVDKGRKSVTNEDYSVKFHMPIYAQLKLNTFSVGSSKLYLSAIGYYNAVRIKELENKFSISYGLGFAWRHFDWHLLYYKQDIKDKYNKGCKYLGTSMTYYFY